MMEDLNDSLFRFRYEDIRTITGCIKPCTYLRYAVSFEQPSTDVETQHFSFSIVVSSCMLIFGSDVKIFFESANN